MNNNQSQVNSTDFGIPHNRPRVYFAGIRRSELLAHFAKTKDEVLAAFMNKKLGRTHLVPKNFRTFLEECGLPIEANSLKVDGVQSMKSVQSDANCTCGVRSLCRLHICKCAVCKAIGHEAMKCIRADKVHAVRAVHRFAKQDVQRASMGEGREGVASLIASPHFEIVSGHFGCLAC
jgi:site-specific DNA-cytosine methylase